MYIIVVGGGKVGYYLTKELIEAGHEVAVCEDEESAQRLAGDVLELIG